MRLALAEGRGRGGGLATPLSGTRHRCNTTSDDSSFARTVTAQRRHATGSDVLRGCVLTRGHGPDTSTTVVTQRRDRLEQITDDLGPRLDVAPAALDRLWRRVCTTHQAWCTPARTVAAPFDALPSCPLAPHPTSW
ncbi:MAG: hypothetical protein ABJA87_11515 [bacterium]